MAWERSILNTSRASSALRTLQQCADEVKLRLG